MQNFTKITLFEFEIKITTKTVVIVFYFVQNNNKLIKFKDCKNEVNKIKI